VDVGAVVADARQDAAAVDEDTGDVEPGHGHDAAGHVLVAAAEGEQAVVVHASGDDLEAVGDDLARHQAVAHALVTHHDAVGGGRGAKDLRYPARGANALTALAGQAVEVGVARGDIAEQRRHADHWPAEVVVEETDGAQHGPVGRPAYPLGGQSAGVLPVG